MQIKIYTLPPSDPILEVILNNESLYTLRSAMSFILNVLLYPSKT